MHLKSTDFSIAVLSESSCNISICVLKLYIQAKYKIFVGLVKHGLKLSTHFCWIHVSGASATVTSSIPTTSTVANVLLV